MNERGVTMIELLVATAIGGVMLLGVTGFYLSALRFNAEGSSQTYLQRQGALVLDELARQIRPASALAIATCNGNANSLQVTNTAAGGGSQTLCFRKSGSQLLEDLPGGTRDLLSGSPSPLTVTSFSPSLSGTGVTITFQLRDQTFTSTDQSHNLLTFTTTLGKRN
jgi:prepilin-type N-terminal cleavage/methylation domain-containing protein